MNQSGRKANSMKLQRLQITGEPWQLQTAKARFSELFSLARTQGPQLILRQKKDGVVMLTVEQFDLLLARAHQAKSCLLYTSRCV